MSRRVDLDELAEKMEGFTLHGGDTALFLECLDCGGCLNVTCPDSDLGDAHVNLNTLVMAAASHSCEVEDTQCPGCCAVEAEDEHAIEVEAHEGIRAIEDYLETLDQTHEHHDYEEDTGP